MSPLLAAAADEAARPTTFMQVTALAELVLVGGVLVVLARRWRARRTAATGCAMGLFGVLALVLVAGQFEVEDTGSFATHSFTVVLVALLLCIPYLLVLMARSLGAISRTQQRVAAGLLVVEVVATIGSPRFPAPGEPRSDWFTAYVVLFLVGWTVQSLIASAGLWRAGKGQPSVVRHRMRTLACGAVLLAITLIGSGSLSDQTGDGQVVVTLLGALSMLLIAVGFVVPEWLRQAWRAEDLSRLTAVERGLMAAVTPSQVASEILPTMSRTFGDRGSALLDASFRPVDVVRLSRTDLAELETELREIDPAVGEATLTEHDALAVRLTDGWLVVHAGQLAPVLGPAELDLVARVGAFVDLALERCRLFAEEARSRQAAEAANAELQTLLYSVSHDLRSPIISVLGYLDVLRQEHRGELAGEGERYLERIEVNAIYMQSLIQDLLELSRIGRTESVTTEVDLGALVGSVAQEVRATYPGVSIDVETALPVVVMNEVRARQLLTNLLDNAAKHAGRERPHVEVSAAPTADGGVELHVVDNGRGVPVAYRQKAFEVFERLDAARLGTPGTGMGLPICRRVVETLGGTIRLDDPPPGADSGTTVTIVLPAPVVAQWPARQEHLMEEENA